MLDLSTDSKRHKADAAVSELLALKLTLTPAPTDTRTPCGMAVTRRRARMMGMYKTSRSGSSQPKVHPILRSISASVGG